MNSKKAKKLRRIARAIARDNPVLTERIYKRMKKIKVPNGIKKN